MIDYMGVDLKHKDLIQDSYAYKCLDLGSDHRAVKLVMNFRRFGIKRRRHRGSQKSNKGWSPRSLPDYHSELDASIADMITSVNLESQAGQLEDQLEILKQLVVETATNCKVLEQRVNTAFRLSAETKCLIERRKLLRKSEASDETVKKERVEISKAIQKHIRKEMRNHKNTLISKKIEAFVDLKRIPAIRGGGKRHNLTSMLDEQGGVRESKQGIVDVFADFYENLYRSRASVRLWDDARQTPELPEVTESEIETALKKLAKKKGWG